MKDSHAKDEDFVKFFNWSSNPFNFRILPEVFVGHWKEVERVSRAIDSGEKFTLVTGPTGSGKTTLMKYLGSRYDSRMKVLYLPKPPKDPQDLIGIFTTFMRPSLVSRILGRAREPTLYNLDSWVSGKIRKDPLLMMVDEGHEASMDTLEWLRTLTDHVEGLTIILAGLPILDRLLTENLETFMRRMSAKLELANLSKSETRELIKRRIEWAGGEDIKPFTQETIDSIYEKTGGFPRETLKLCGELANNAARSNLTTIDNSFVREAKSPEPQKKLSADSVDSLPEKQREIIMALSRNGSMSPAEIIHRMGSSGYKDKENAVRSINNILKRLTKDGYVERKGRGKGFTYAVSGKIRNVLVEA